MPINTSVTKSDFPVITGMTKSPSSFVALSIATGLDEETLVSSVIPEVVKTQSWKKIGLSAKEIRAVLKHLNIEVKDLGITLVVQNDAHSDTIHTRKMEKQFVEKNAREGKTYIVSSRDHFWVIHDKKTIDPTWVVASKQGSRRRLTTAIEVINSNEAA